MLILISSRFSVKQQIIFINWKYSLYYWYRICNLQTLPSCSTWRIRCTGFEQWSGKFILNLYEIKVREYRRSNQKITIQRNWQHMVHKTKTNETKTRTLCYRKLSIKAKWTWDRYTFRISKMNVLSKARILAKTRRETIFSPYSQFFFIEEEIWLKCVFWK